MQGENKRAKGSILWPPPERPIDDEDAKALRRLTVYCKEALTAKGERSPEHVTELRNSRKLVEVLGRYRSKHKELSWALYNSHSLGDWFQKAESDLTYFKGDIVQIIDTQGQWVLGTCRGRLGITPLNHLSRDNFGRALRSFEPNTDDEIAIAKGQIIPVVPSEDEGWLMAYTAEEEGRVPADCVETLEAFAQGTKIQYPEYTPLKHDEIRLICMTARDKSAKAACNGDSSFFSLITVRLDEAPAFTALSYCWGDDECQDVVFCNDKPLRVSRNLATLLKWFPIPKTYSLIVRKKEISQAGENANIDEDHVALLETTPYPDDETLYLWADAVCINQSDMYEKAHQIPLMKDIYGRARDVRVYLGEVEDIWDVFLGGAVIQQVAGIEYRSHLSADLHAHLGKCNFGAFLKFCCNPVFQRSWMIQEMILGRELTLWSGNVNINLGMIQSYIHFISSLNLKAVVLANFGTTLIDEKTSQIGFHNAHKLAKLKYAREHGINMSFIEILSLFRGAKAREPRDKIYSLLSLSDDHYQQNITPSYAESITLNTLSIQVANLAISSPNQDDVRALLEHSGSYNSFPELTTGLPSWVPDWTTSSCRPLTKNLYSCAGPTPTNIRLKHPDASPGCASIVVKGAVVDILHWLGSRWLNNCPEQPIPDVPQATSTYLASICVHEQLHRFSTMLSDKHDVPYPNARTTYKDAVWQSLLCGEAWGQRRAGSQDKRHYEAFCRKIGIEKDRAADHTDDDYPFNIMVTEVMHGRRCGLTRNMYMGTFPNGAEEHDFVFVLQGFSVPFVLRVVDDGDESHEQRNMQFKLIGPCYVHGIMDGELVRVEMQDGVETIKVKGRDMEDVEIV